MDLHEYRCLDCGAGDKRIAGLDDSVAVCYDCGGLMLRISNPWDLFLWDEGEKQCSQKK